MRTGRVGMRVLATTAVAWLSFVQPAWGDAVDEAFAAGNAAANAHRWDDAVLAYEEADRLVAGRNSTLSYDLGTAYAHLGELGLATYHLRRALDFRGGPSTEVLEAARRNLELVRRRAELQATAAGAQIDRPATWWDLLLDALRAPWIGWMSLTSGVALLALLWLWRRRRAQGAIGGVVPPALVVVGAVYLAAGALHGLALRADSIAPQAIVLETRVDVRERAGTHANPVFVLQGGARLRIVETVPGWRRIRLPGGLEGWVPESAVGELDASSHVVRRSADRSRSRASS